MKKNIAIVTTWFERGAAYVSKQYADALISQGYNVFIYARGGELGAEENHPWSDYDVTSDSSPRLPMPTAINKSKFDKFIKTNAISIVFFNEQQYWQPVLWAKEHGCLTVAYIDYYTTETVSLFNIYDVLLCNTKRHFSAFDWHRSVHYIPWGTDLDIFKPREFVAKEKIVFFHSAGMNPKRKGTDLVLRAFAQMNCATSTLLIHSQVSLNSIYPQFGELVDRLVLDGRLELVEETVSAPGLYGKADIYVYPSRLDGLGLTVPEALACGLPVITTDEPPMNEFIDQSVGRLVTVASHKRREDGYFWDMAEPDLSSLIFAMRCYIDDPTLLVRQREAVHRRRLDSLDWVHNSSTLGAVLENVKPSKVPIASVVAAVEMDSKRVLYYSKLSILYNVVFHFLFLVKRKFF